MTATESLLPEIINDFFNKICQQQPLAVRKTNRPFRRLTTVKSVTDTSADQAVILFTTCWRDP